MTAAHIVMDGRELRLVGSLELERDEQGTPTIFMPQSRYALAASTALNRYGRGPFCKFRVQRLPKASGVYAIVGSDGPLYVGRAKDLSKRFSMGHGSVSPKNCYIGGQETTCRINNLVLLETLAGRQLDLFVLECADYEKFESDLLAQLDLPWNLKS